MKHPMKRLARKLLLVSVATAASAAALADPVHDSRPACNEALVKYDKLTSSGEWTAMTALSRERQAILFGWQKAYLHDIQRECGGATPRSTQLLRQAEQILDALTQAKNESQPVPSTSMTCFDYGWTIICN